MGGGDLIFAPSLPMVTLVVMDLPELSEPMVDRVLDSSLQMVGRDRLGAEAVFADLGANNFCTPKIN